MAGRDGAGGADGAADGKQGANTLKVEARIGDPGNAMEAFTSP